MLLLKGNDAGALRRRIVHDPHAAALAQTFLDKAQGILSTPLMERRFETGRRVMLPTSRLMSDRVFLLGIAFFLTGGQIYRRRLIDEMLAVSAFPDWNEIHFLDTAEMLTAVAIGYDWCASLLTDSEKRVIGTAIMEFAMIPGLHALIDNSKWTRIPTNWNVVCSASLIIGALAVEKSSRDISAEVLEKAIKAIRVGLSAYDGDGGWPEGISYWEYATRFAVLALAALESRDCTFLTIDDFPALFKTWRFGRALTAPSGTAFDSGDSVAVTRRLPVYGWLAQKCGDVDAANWQWRAPGDLHPLDLLWFAPVPVNHVDTRPRVEIFHGAGYATVTSRQGDTYLAIRGGSNSTNHAHLDLGTFIFEYEGVRFVSDLGREDYAAPGYFKAETRFTYFLTQTRAHNTIHFAGHSQSLDASADFVERDDARQIACLIRDHDAPFDHVRAFSLSRDNSAIVVDRLSPAKKIATPVEVIWNLHTQAEVSICETGLKLTLGGMTIQLAISHPPNATLTVSPVCELASAKPAFNRISLKLDAMSEVTIAAVFSTKPDHDAASDIASLERWLEELMQPALL
ncbi:heparinase II/III family protein [Shinella sp.]|uniref:heparinase II/III domain-containing protein n=1 Tax=Shinella sp. TaxID=1870904 RepID=UPI0028AFC8C6|nr:heparinase II/III family protein [Shinella sp.]